VSVGAVERQSWGEYFVELDENADFIPFVSTVTNVSDLVLKGALNLMDQKRLSEALKSHFLKHIYDKSTLRSITLLIPILGNGIVYLYDVKTGKVEQQEFVNQEGEILPLEEAKSLLEEAFSERSKEDEVEEEMILYFIPEMVEEPVVESSESIIETIENIQNLELMEYAPSLNKLSETLPEEQIQPPSVKPLQVKSQKPKKTKTVLPPKKKSPHIVPKLIKAQMRIKV